MPAGPLENVGDTVYRVCQRFGRCVYKNGKVLAVAPSLTLPAKKPTVILGAAQMTYQSDKLKKTYLVAALTCPSGAVGFLHRDSNNQNGLFNPECVDHVIAWAEIKSGQTVTPQDWHILHTEALSADPRRLLLLRQWKTVCQPGAGHRRP